MRLAIGNMTFCCALLMGVGAFFEPLPAADRPNIVFILADDLGWSDTSVYGSTFHHTPNIDRLAQRGVRFTNAHTANPLCSPTRASILTGRYPGRIGIITPSCHLPEVRLEAVLDQRGRPTEKALTPLSATRLKTSYPTIARTLRDAGYATGHFGKWHLGHAPYSAREHGFDVDVPHFPGPGPAGSYLAPWQFPSLQGEPGEHIEDRMAKEAVAFMRANKDRPFFLNYWSFSVHGPWDANPQLVRHYRAQAAPDSPQRNPVYAAMVHSLDDAVGTLLAALEQLKIADRTIVVFFSDNGGVHWLDERMETRFGLESPPTSNAPLRGGKATLYEGGTRVPCIIVWPGRTQAGTQSDALFSSVDWAPTLLAMAGVDAAPMEPLDGMSQVPAIVGKGAPRDTAYCYFPAYTPATGNLPGVWVRRGDYKLVRFFFDSAGQTDRFELYDLRKDVGESENLADQMPEKVRELSALIDAHLEQIKPVLPRANPAYAKGGMPGG